ncbi:type II toxin-antitoxin system RelE/ParE family toxin [bacterium]|nr:type II toxin-antitoxin system RelE/ParE family toxin [bacterium]
MWWIKAFANILFINYILFYKIIEDKKEVHILAVLNHRRDYAKIL